MNDVGFLCLISSQNTHILMINPNNTMNGVGLFLLLLWVIMYIYYNKNSDITIKNVAFFFLIYWTIAFLTLDKYLLDELYPITWFKILHPWISHPWDAICSEILILWNTILYQYKFSIHIFKKFKILNNYIFNTWYKNWSIKRIIIKLKNRKR